MSEQREDFLMEIEEKLFQLTVEELCLVCECFKIFLGDEQARGKTRRALVKLIIKFCKREKLLEEEDEGMSVLLELNDQLEDVLRGRSPGGDAKAHPCRHNLNNFFKEVQEKVNTT